MKTPIKLQVRVYNTRQGYTYFLKLGKTAIAEADGFSSEEECREAGKLQASVIESHYHKVK